MPRSDAVDHMRSRDRPIAPQYGFRDLCVAVFAVCIALAVAVADSPKYGGDMYLCRGVSCGLLVLSVYLGWIRKDGVTATCLALIAWCLVLIGVLLGIIDGFSLIGTGMRPPV